MRNTLSQIRTFLLESGARPEDLSRRARAVLYLTRLVLRIIRQWLRDKCPQQAAALAYQTALSLVPVTAIVFTGLRWVPMDVQERLQDFLSNRVLPGLGDVTERIQSFSEKVSTDAMGMLGLFFTLFVAYTLYKSIEGIFNDIWRVGQRRTLIGRFLTFYALFTLGPVVAGMSLYWSGKLVGRNAAAQFLAPLGIQLIFLVVMNKLLPRTNVKWRAAVIGGLFTGVAFEVTKWIFVRYAKRILLDSYSGIYGPLGLIPLLLLWIYVSWLLVLLGAEFAHAVQNLRVLEAEDRRRRGDEPINGLMATQLLAAIAVAHEQRGEAMPKEKLVTDFGLTPEIVERIIGRLKQRGLVAEVHGDRNGYVPGRASTRIELDEVLAVFRANDLEIAHASMTALPLRELVKDLEEARQKRIAGLRLCDLLPGADHAGEGRALPAGSR